MDYEFFMSAALAEAQKALVAGEFPVGCVLVSDNRIVASGSRTGTVGDGKNEIDHAEMVALRQLMQSDQGPAPSSLSAFSTMEPCLMCFGGLLINNVTEIVYAYEDAMGGATSCRLSDLGPLYRYNDLKIRPHVMRSESLALFKEFFAKPENAYWRDSLLARYTLEQ